MILCSTTNYNPPSYRSLNTRSFINGFSSNSARDTRDFANLSSYTRRSNSDYALPRIYQPTPPMTVTPWASIAQRSPSLTRRFARLSTHMRDLLPPDEHKPDNVLHAPNQERQTFYTRKLEADKSY